MREIKFKAWDGEKMYYAELDEIIMSMGSQGAGDWHLDEEIGEDLAGFAGYRRNEPLRDVKIMQYTGHKDKKGCEIYEGDIVKADWCWTEPHLITWPHDEYDFIEFGLDTANVEVIGNLYETPELVKATESEEQPE